MSASKGRDAPSTWFVAHANLFATGHRVLDLACGRGRHAIAAAQLGAHVTAIDADAEKLRVAAKLAQRAGVDVTWIQANLERDPVPAGPFDVVMMFNYLDRTRIAHFLAAVKPGGFFLGETFLERQRDLGWGPTSDDHLLKTMEFPRLVAPFTVVFAREVLEILDGHPRVIAGVLAQRPVG